MSLAREIARFREESCVRADRRSALAQHGQSVREAMRFEWTNGQAALQREGIAGATRFANGAGRHGDFSKI